MEHPIEDLTESAHEYQVFWEWNCSKWRTTRAIIEFKKKNTRNPGSDPTRPDPLLESWHVWSNWNFQRLVINKTATFFFSFSPLHRTSSSLLSVFVLTRIIPCKIQRRRSVLTQEGKFKTHKRKLVFLGRESESENFLGKIQWNLWGDYATHVDEQRQEQLTRQGIFHPFAVVEIEAFPVTANGGVFREEKIDTQFCQQTWSFSCHS